MHARLPISARDGTQNVFKDMVAVWIPPPEDFEFTALRTDDPVDPPYAIKETLTMPAIDFTNNAALYKQVKMLPNRPIRGLIVKIEDDSPGSKLYDPNQFGAFLVSRVLPVS